MKKEVSLYLDFLRLMAGLAVFFGHSYLFTGETWGRLMAGFRTDAVALFFVISGFVIAYVTSGREKTLQQYAIARLGRLYSVAVPAVLLTLACDSLGLMASPRWYLGQWWFNSDTGVADVLRYLTFSNELWNSHIMVGSDEPYWSLGFEAPYYMIYAAAVFPLRNRLVNLAATVALAVLFGPKILSYLPLWLIGVASFHLLHADAAWSRRLTARTWSLTLAVTPILFAGLKIAAHYNPSWQTNMFEPFAFSASYYVPVLYYTTIGLLTGVSIVAVANLSTSLAGAARLAEKPIRWLAGGTFTLYLVHQPILLLLVTYIPGNPDTVERAVVIQLTTLIAVYCIAEVTERRKTLWTSAISAVFGVGRRAIGGVVVRSRSW